MIQWRNITIPDGILLKRTDGTQHWRLVHNGDRVLVVRVWGGGRSDERVDPDDGVCDLPDLPMHVTDTWRPDAADLLTRYWLDSLVSRGGPEQLSVVKSAARPAPLPEGPSLAPAPVVRGAYGRIDWKTWPVGIALLHTGNGARYRLAEVHPVVGDMCVYVTSYQRCISSGTSAPIYKEKMPNDFLVPDTRDKLTAAWLACEATQSDVRKAPEPKTRDVYVVSWSPSSGSSRNGGFGWRANYADALHELLRCIYSDTDDVASQPQPRGRNYTLCAVPVPVARIGGDEVTEWLSKHHDLFEPSLPTGDEE